MKEDLKALAIAVTTAVIIKAGEKVVDRIDERLEEKRKKRKAREDE